MYLSAGEYWRAYDAIKTTALKNSNANCSIFVFVATPDADAVCACKIFTELLAYDYLAHKVIPVGGFDDIARANELLISSNANVKSLVFINCGAIVDLGEFLTLVPDMSVYVVDNHRPINLDNLFHHKQICILDDGDVADLTEEMAAYQELELEQLSSDGDGEEETDDDEFEESADSPRPLFSAASDNESVDEEEAVGKENTPANLKRSRSPLNQSDARRNLPSPRESTQGRKNRRHICRGLLEEYYAMTWFGHSAAGIFFQMASQISRHNNDQLWWAIVGLADQEIYEKTSADTYSEQIEHFRDIVGKLNDSEVASNLGPEPCSQSAENFGISYKKRELRFMLFRHWSLYDSMYHSSYVASKLGLWKDHGRKKLQNLLAQMGFSLVQCNQPYYEMDFTLRKDIYEKLEEKAVAYGLTNLSYSTFQRHFGFKCILSAADVVHGLTALLETSGDIAKALGVELDMPGYGAEQRMVLNEEADALGGNNGFYLAMDALSNINLLKVGVDLSQRLQRAIVRSGASIIEERLVKTLNSFRLVVLKEDIDITLFIHPLTLTRLAMFLMDAMKETGRRLMPFVIAALNSKSDSYIVVGVDGRCDGSRKSKFGQAFRKTADETKSRTRQDRFNTSFIELAKDDLAKFMEHLQVHA